MWSEEGRIPMMSGKDGERIIGRGTMEDEKVFERK